LHQFLEFPGHPHGTLRKHRRCGFRITQPARQLPSDILLLAPDHALYRDLLIERCRKASIDAWT
jgi:hypothetical protein